MTGVAMPDNPLPAPNQMRRDSMGRLVAATWHGPGASPAPDRTGRARWLVAVDGSANALRAAAMAARLAALRPHAEVDLVHVEPWLSKEAAEAELMQRSWAAAAPARHLLEAAALRWHLHALMGGDAAAEVVGLAQALGSCGIAMGSQGQTAAQSLFMGSVAYKLVHLSRVPVLVVAPDK